MAKRADLRVRASWGGPPSVIPFFCRSFAGGVARSFPESPFVKCSDKLIGGMWWHAYHFYEVSNVYYKGYFS